MFEFMQSVSVWLSLFLLSCCLLALLKIIITELNTFPFPRRLSATDLSLQPRQAEWLDIPLKLFESEAEAVII